MSINSLALREVLSADRPLLQMKRQSDFHVNGVRMSFSSEASEKMNFRRRERLPRANDTRIAFSHIPHAALVQKPIHKNSFVCLPVCLESEVSVNPSEEDRGTGG